ALLQNPGVRRVYDHQLRDPIVEAAARGDDRDQVALAEVLERTEQRVAMAGNRAVARLTGQHGVRQVAGRDAQRAVVVALGDPDQHAESGHLETPERRPTR